MARRKWNDQDLIKAVANSFCISDVLKELKINHRGQNGPTIKKHIEKLSLTTSHWRDQVITKVRTGHEIPIEDVFVINSTFTRSHLKDKIIKHQLLDYQCIECGMLDTWNNKPITLQLDHINGINTDHRLVNLRFLCPNCHSQTNNFAGGNATNRKTSIKRNCLKCNNYISRVSKSGLCNMCRCTQDKFHWPSDDQLIELLITKTPYAISKELKVSFTSLYKRLKKKNIKY